MTKKKYGIDRTLCDLEDRIKAMKSDACSIGKFRKHGILSVWTIASELLAGFVVGLLLGIYLDRVFHTLPVFLIVCTLFGSYGGLYNVYRGTMRRLKEKKKVCPGGRDIYTNGM